jgi:hypothetical protein
MKCAHCGTEVWSDQGSYRHLEESDGTAHTPERCAATSRALADVGTRLLEQRPLSADPVFVLNALVLLCATRPHLDSVWDHVTLWGAIFNVAFYVFRVYRVSRWEKLRDAWVRKAP